MSGDLTPPFQWSVVESLYFEPLYSEAAVLELFSHVGLPPNGRDKVEAVAFALSEAGKGFALDLWRERQPSASQYETGARRLAAACLSVLQAVGVGNDEPSDNLFPMFGKGGLFAAASLRGEPNGQAATMNALRAVHLLRQDALKMAEIGGKRSAMKPPKAGRPQERAIARLVAALALIYFRAWDALPTVARGKANDPCGPFVRLMVHVTEALRARGLKFHSSAESLAKQWERLPPEDKLRLDIDTTPAA